MTTVFLMTESSWQSSCLASKLLLTISFSFQGPKSAACEPDWLLQLIAVRSFIFTDICFGQSQLPASPPSLVPTMQHSQCLPFNPLYRETWNLGFAIGKAKFGVQTARKDSGNLVRCLCLLQATA